MSADNTQDTVEINLNPQFRSTGRRNCVMQIQIIKSNQDTGANDRCIYWRIVKGYNNLRVLDLVTTNISSAEEDKVYEIILYVVEERMNERILVGIFSAMRTNDEATQGYY